MNASVRSIVLTWLAWVLIVIGFQAVAVMRFGPHWPDRALDWTAESTGRNYQKEHAYLLEPFMNNQVAWDSEYYLGIAVGGYDNPLIPALTNIGYAIPALDKRVAVEPGPGRRMSLSYAFLPFYPLVIRLMMVPLGLLGLNPIATASLAGVLVSALGALAGALALYDLARGSLGEEGGLRAAFFLMIFPTGFFLVQVYSEGLFVGLAFGCLAMVRRGRWWPAALLAAAATLTRAVGVALLVPMVMEWFRSRDFYLLDLEWRQLFHQGIPWRPLARLLLVLAPMGTFLLWKYSYLGFAFSFIEAQFFGRGLMNIGGSLQNWVGALRSMLSMDSHQMSGYYFTEFFGIVLGFVAIWRCLKRDAQVGWFSLVVFVVSLTSGPAQGMHRYVLAAPAVFITLADWGGNPRFERAWTIGSILLMGMLAAFFALNMWVA